MEELPESLKSKLADIDNEIVEMKARADKPFADKEARIARIQSHYLQQVRNNVLSQIVVFVAAQALEDSH